MIDRLREGGPTLFSIHSNERADELGIDPIFSRRVLVAIDDQNLVAAATSSPGKTDDPAITDVTSTSGNSFLGRSNPKFEFLQLKRFSGDTNSFVKRRARRQKEVQMK